MPQTSGVVGGPTRPICPSPQRVSMLPFCPPSGILQQSQQPRSFLQMGKGFGFNPIHSPAVATPGGLTNALSLVGLRLGLAEIRNHVGD